MNFSIYELKNGIRCVLQRVESPVVWCALTVDTGSRDERKNEHGMAHFTEHMLFKGTTKRRSHHINSRLERLGGELNAYTTKEETTVYATVLRGDLPKAVELIADVVFRSTFPERELQREREVIADEIDSYKDSPAELIFDEFEENIFANSPLAHNILGVRRDVMKVNRGAVERFVSRTYNTSRMVFSVVGNITERAFIAIMERYFGDIDCSERAFSRTLPPQVEHFDRSMNKRTHQAHCVLGTRAYGAQDPLRTPLSLLVNMIGGPAANSQLNSLLREKNGLTYTAEAAYTPFSDVGLTTIYFGTEQEKIARCREIIDNILGEFRTRKMSSQRLAMAKKQFIGQLSIAQQSYESAMFAAGKSLLFYGDVEQPQAIFDAILAVTPEQIMEVANEIFDKMSVLIYH